MGTLGITESTRRPVRAVVVKIKPLRPSWTLVRAACNWCKVVGGHLADCGLRMDGPEMVPGSEAAFEDRKAGL